MQMMNVIKELESGVRPNNTAGGSTVDVASINISMIPVSKISGPLASVWISWFRW